jgi:hypothetical protein
MVLPERLPVISGLRSRPGATLGYLPGDRLAINCTSGPSHPAPALRWLLNGRPVDRWMVTSYLPRPADHGLTSSVLGLSFLLLAEHFRGPERELWATCRANMPAVQGVQLPVERTLLLGSLAQRPGGERLFVQGGWSSGAGRAGPGGLGPGIGILLLYRGLL